ncbi:hypothetical protein [Fulvivirga kasyanovii]|uniref:Uncharacterized protein n=1 Tax=Fulvivirga kasyanovii TaxID=396812 RepID=A0ABW9RVI7_9BACT|nr:hypothetical protein [Fulvivirga kasyanovii]MTI27258.1 hypothetical protein [Fulvivirga kasyanovii]
MRHVSILLQTVAKQFYIQNSGFFLLLLFFGIGFLSGKEHVAIASSVAQSPMLLLYTMIGWSIYLWATFRFSLEAFSSKENLWIRNVIFYSSREQWNILLTMQAALSAPIIAYGAFTGIFMFKYHNWINLGTLLSYICIGSVLPVYLYRKHLAQPISNTRPNRLKTAINKWIATPAWLWPLSNLLHTRLWLYLATKALSIAVLIAFQVIDDIQVYDWRWQAIGMLLVSMANITLILELFKFHKQSVPWMINMPLSGIKRVIIQWSGILLLMLPEIWVLIRYFPSERSAELLLSLIIYGLCIGLSLFASFFIFSSEAEDALKKYFYFFISLFLLSLFGVPVILTSLLLFAFTFTVHILYYRVNLD